MRFKTSGGKLGDCHTGKKEKIMQLIHRNDATGNYNQHVEIMAVQFSVDLLISRNVA